MFALFGGLGDIIAPRPEPKEEFFLLLRANQQAQALSLLRTSHPTWVDDLNVTGLNPLHIAAGSGAVEIVLELLSQGANVNCVSSSGCTSVHYAATNNRKGIVELLLRSGADPSIPNNKGEVAAEICQDPEIVRLLLRDRSQLSASKTFDIWHQNQTQEETSRRSVPLFNSSFNASPFTTSSSKETKAVGEGQLTPISVDDIDTAARMLGDRNADRGTQSIGDLGFHGAPSVLSLSELRSSVDISRIRLDASELADPVHEYSHIENSDILHSFKHNPTPRSGYPFGMNEGEAMAVGRSLVSTSPKHAASALLLPPDISTNPSPITALQLPPSFGAASTITSPRLTIVQKSGNTILSENYRDDVTQLLHDWHTAMLLANSESLEGSLRNILLLACIYDSFDEELVSSLLQDRPHLALARIADCQVSRIRQMNKHLVGNMVDRKVLPLIDLNLLPESVNGLSYLHLAAGCGNAAMAAMLLDMGAKALSVDLQGRTPLHVAVAWGGALIHRIDAPNNKPEFGKVAVAEENDPGSLLGDDDDLDYATSVDDYKSRMEAVCELLSMAMSMEGGSTPKGDKAPLDKTGSTPLGLYNHFNGVDAESRNQVAVDCVSAIPLHSCNHILDLPTANISRKVGDGEACLWVPAQSTQELLLGLGDLSIIPRAMASTRSGRNPWRLLSGGDRENVVYATSDAKMWSKSISERAVAICPLPGRPVWNLFGLCSSDGRGESCASLVAEYFSKTVAHEADRYARVWGSAGKAGGLAGDTDTTPEMLAEILHVACQLTDKKLHEHECFRVSSICIDPQMLRLIDDVKSPRKSVSRSNFDTHSYLQAELLRQCSVVNPVRDVSCDVPQKASVNISASNGFACACMTIVSADYLAVCTVGDMAAVLAQRSAAEPRGSFAAGEAIFSPFGQSVNPDSDASSESYSFSMGENGAVRRRQSRGSLVASLVSPQNSKQLEAVFGKFLDKKKAGMHFLQRKYSDVDGFGDTSPETWNENATVSTRVAVFHRSTRDAFYVIASPNLWKHMQPQEVVDFIAIKLGYSAYGGPVGGVSGIAATEACDALVDECISRGCVRNIAVVLVLLGPPADPNRRGSPALSMLEPPQAFSARGDSITPTQMNSTGTPGLPIPAATSSQRRNSRRNTPSTMSMQQAALTATMSSTENRPAARRNTPGSVTLQAYLEAAHIGAASSLADDDSMNAPLISTAAMSSAQSSAAMEAESSRLHCIAEVLSSSPHTSTQDDADYHAVHSTLSEGSASASVSSELYHYHHALSPLRQPEYRKEHGFVSSIGVSTPMEVRHAGSRRTNITAAPDAVSSKSGQSNFSPDSRRVSHSPPTAGIPLVTATTPVSSLRSIFAMVSSEDEESSPFNPATAREAVRKQLGFNDG